MNVFRLGLPLAAALLLCVAVAAPARADEAGASATVVHGIPGLVVDVYVNGDLALPSFQPGTVTDALALPAGDYLLEIYAEGANPDVDDPALSASATLEAGDNVSIVAHLDASGAPTISLFANDISLPESGNGRVVVRHVAAAPAVDVQLERRLWRWWREAAVLEDLSNGDEGSGDVRARTYRATIFAAGTHDRVAGPVSVKVRRDEATIVYAIGDLGGGSFDLLVQSLPLTGTTALASVVHGVPGLVVDVYVNGGLLLGDFQPGTITDPLELAPGTYDVVIVAAGGDPALPAISGSATLAAGDNVSLVAHLTADGMPTLSPFVNDVSSAGGWRSRLDVRHAAAAPAVDVILRRCIGWRYFRAGTLRDIENGEQEDKGVFPGHYTAEITLAGNRKASVLGPAGLEVEPKMLYAVYAIGSAEDGTLDLLVQELPLRR